MIKPWDRNYSQHPKNYKTFFMTTLYTTLNTVHVMQEAYKTLQQSRV